MRDFHSLRAWQKSHTLTLEVYRRTARFPTEELYGMRSQLRRAAASISTNLAEACGRGGDRDFARFVQIALGSASETEYLLLLAKDLEYLSEKDQIDLTANVREVKKMLSGLRRKGEEYVQASRKPLMADG